MFWHVNKMPALTYKRRYYNGTNFLDQMCSILNQNYLIRLQNQRSNIYIMQTYYENLCVIEQYVFISIYDYSNL